MNESKIPATRSGKFISKFSRRLYLPKRILYFLLLLIASWCVMTFTHESGHILCGWIGGGTLKMADLLPWHLPQSIFEPDPHPLFTLWGGPLLGVILPALFALIVRKPWMMFIAYFCILANGLYLASAWMTGDRFLDTPKLLAHGAHPVTILLYCAVTIGFGYWGFRRECVKVLFGTSPISASPNKTIAPETSLE